MKLNLTRAAWGSYFLEPYMREDLIVAPFSTYGSECTQFKVYTNWLNELFETSYLHSFCFKSNQEVRYTRVYINDIAVSNQTISSATLIPRGIQYIVTDNWNYYAILFSSKELFIGA